MEKKILCRNLKTYCNGKEMITPRKVREFTGYGQNKVAEMLKGLDYLPDGNTRRYFILDVAERILERTIR